MNVADLLIELIPGIGPAYARRLHKLGINTLFELLTFAPRSYETHQAQAQLADFSSKEKAIISGRVLLQKTSSGARRMLNVLVDCNGTLVNLRFFHFYPSQLKLMSPGNFIEACGIIKQKLSQYEMVHPQVAPSTMPEPEQTTLTVNTRHESKKLEPLYPLTEGINNQKLKKFIEQALKLLHENPLPELMPETIRTRLAFSTINQALSFIHQPKPDDKAHLHLIQQGLAFEELLAYRLALKQYYQTDSAAPRLQHNPSRIENFIQQLPYTLTAAQRRCFEEISHDLSQDKPMLRLLQGDVGAGKTLVAQLASITAIDSAVQVALMVPTEILAQQHYAKTCALFEALGIQVGLLSGKLKAKQKQDLYQALADGSCQMVIGTHALIQEAVSFKNLGLVIIDEQHRFGVNQRLSLQQKTKVLENGKEQAHTPHQLIMTATPIPRTLAMSIYAELSISALDELPKGRKPVLTTLCAQEKRQHLLSRIAHACEQGRQVYWVCPLIEASDILLLEAASVTYQRLQKELGGIRLGLLHGRLSSQEKLDIMEAFSIHKLDLLVATTVIEVGVDVPNASIIVIENPECMGLAQLHQLRGRVGRGTDASHCVLLYQGPLSAFAEKRLIALRDHHDGFYLAEEDLRLRGPGEFLGVRQTGLLNFRLASLTRDAAMLGEVNSTANLMQEQYPEASKALIERWFGTKQKYSKA